MHDIDKKISDIRTTVYVHKNKPKVVLAYRGTSMATARDIKHDAIGEDGKIVASQLLGIHPKYSTKRQNMTATKFRKVRRVDIFYDTVSLEKEGDPLHCQSEQLTTIGRMVSGQDQLSQNMLGPRDWPLKRFSSSQ